MKFLRLFLFVTCLFSCNAQTVSMEKESPEEKMGVKRFHYQSPSKSSKALNKNKTLKSDDLKKGLLFPTDLESLTEDETSDDVELENQEKQDEGYKFPTLERLKEEQPQLFDGVNFDELKLFGNRIFDSLSARESGGFVGSRPVPDNYVLGPGDELSIHVWNSTQDHIIQADITKSGTIRFPLAGEIHILGLKKKELKNYLHSKLKSFYNELNISFELLHLRQFPVYVTGEVKKPGIFVADALSSPIEAISEMGGLTEDGSLRNVVVRRRGEVATQMDLYDFLREGKLPEGFFFEPEDVLHIPVAKKLLAILGRVRKPGIYELLEKEELPELLKLSGGAESDADKNLVQVISFEGNGEARIQDVDLTSAKGVSLQDGGIVLLHPGGGIFLNRIEIAGNVYKPGIYEWAPGITVKSLVEKAQGFKPDTYMQRAEILRRLDSPIGYVSNTAMKVLTSVKVIPINLQDEMVAKLGTILQKQDTLQVFHFDEVQEAPFVEIYGEVVNSGRLMLKGDVHLKDILFEAQLTSKSYMLKGEIARQSASGMKIIDFRVASAMLGVKKHNIKLENQDVISIFKEPSSESWGKITLAGEVKFPGVYVFPDGEKLSDVLKRAGGLTDTAYIPGAKFLRLRIQKQQQKIRDQFVKREKNKVNSMKEVVQGQLKNEDSEQQEALQDLNQISLVMERLEDADIEGRLSLDMSSIKNLVQLASSENNVQLEDGDYFEVPAKPSEVSIIGQVHSPCTLLYRKGASIDSYLNYAGGLTGQADRNQIYILRIGGEAVPLKTLHRGRRSEPQGVYVASLKDSSDHTLMGTSLQPGDTIIVPAKLRIGKSRFKEMLDITYKTAVSVGAMISLFD